MKLSSATKSPWRSSTLRTSTARSGAARNKKSSRAITKSAAWPTRSLGSVLWRIATATISGLEETQPLGQDAQLELASRREALFGEEVEREVHGERLAEAVGGPPYQAVGAEELDLLDAGIEHIRVAGGDRAGDDVLGPQVSAQRRSGNRMGAVAFK